MITIISRQKGCLQVKECWMSPGGECRVHSCMYVHTLVCECMHACVCTRAQATHRWLQGAGCSAPISVRQDVCDFWIPMRNEQDQEATREPLTAQHLAWNGQGLGARGWPRAWPRAGRAQCSREGQPLPLLTWELSRAGRCLICALLSPDRENVPDDVHKETPEATWQRAPGVWGPEALKQVEVLHLILHL